MGEAGIVEYPLTQLDRVVSGAGAVSRAGAELDRLGASRAVVVTGRTLAASALLDRLRVSLGPRCVAVFSGVRQHVPSSSVAALGAVLDAHGADGVVSFGGGSPIDAAKAAVHARLTTGSGRGLPHLAIPTTLSAGEFTAVAGVTDDATHVKHAIVDPRLAPRVVVLDPELTAETPRWLWAASGMRAVDHAVETLYSRYQHPVSSSQAARALTLLVEYLPRSVQGSPGERLQCQLAAWLSVQGMAFAGLGLSHALGHQIGPRWQVAHGVTSCITLPHVMRLLAVRAPDRFETIAAALGVPFAPDAGTAAAACADTVAGLVARLGLPARLRDVGVPRSELDAVAQVVHDALSHHQRVGQEATLADLAGVLASAY